MVFAMMAMLSSPVHRAEIVYVSVAFVLTMAFGVWHYLSRITTDISLRIHASIFMTCTLLVSYNLFHLFVGGTDPHVWYCISVLVCFTCVGVAWPLYCYCVSQQRYNHDLNEHDDIVYNRLSSAL